MPNCRIVRGPENEIENMADETELTQKRRGRYVAYLRHSNPYIFPAASRRKQNLQKVNKSSNVTHNGFNKCESSVQEVFCVQVQ